MLYLYSPRFLLTMFWVFKTEKINRVRSWSQSPRTVFIFLLKLCIDWNVFEFEGLFFRQRFGIPIGSLLSPVMTGLLMEYFERELLPTSSTLQPLWISYVDDILHMWRKEGDFDDFHLEVNSFAPIIQFKIEWEDGERIPFLDRMTYRLPTLLSFTVYRKTYRSTPSQPFY